LAGRHLPRRLTSACEWSTWLLRRPAEPKLASAI
jgi:hypothetical protein